MCERINFTMEKSKNKEKPSYYDKRPVLGEQGSWKIREHFGKGFTAFLVIAAAIVFFFAFLRFSYIFDLMKTVIGLIKPIIYGVVIAYLLNPIVEFTEKYTVPFLGRYIKKEKTLHKLCRGIGVFSALIVMGVLITGLLNMVIPELFKSIKDLVDNLPGQIQNWIAWVNEIQSGETFVDRMVKNGLVQAGETLENWVNQADFLSRANVIMTSVMTGAINVVNGLLNIIVGIIVSVYALFSKEQFLGQGRKIIYAVMSPKRANLTLHIARKSNEIFGGFIIGKIIDSAIIGVLCFIGVSILKMPYALLVSVFVGVTNVIPYFGPFIGAIPSAILIMLADPMQGLYFVIFILLLQQLDGNVIGPTILGDSTGLSAFWVVFSILLFGGLFGVVGMIIGVPTFAVFYYIVNLLITQKLEDKKLPTATSSYNGMNYVDDEGNYVSVEEADPQATKLQGEKGE